MTISSSHPASFAAYYDRTEPENRGSYERQRGEVLVDDGDGKILVYTGIKRSCAGAFRRWVREVFLSDDGRDRVAGRWPEYRIQTR